MLHLALSRLLWRDRVLLLLMVPESRDVVWHAEDKCDTWPREPLRHVDWPHLSWQCWVCDGGLLCRLQQDGARGGLSYETKVHRIIMCFDGGHLIRWWRGAGAEPPVHGQRTGADVTEAEEMWACQNCVTAPSRVTIMSRICHSGDDVLYWGELQLSPSKTQGLFGLCLESIINMRTGCFKCELHAQIKYI